MVKTKSCKLKGNEIEKERVTREMEVLMRARVMVRPGGSFTPINTFDAAALRYILEE